MTAIERGDVGGSSAITAMLLPVESMPELEEGHGLNSSFFCAKRI
jgi:hypothetical protein